MIFRLARKCLVAIVLVMLVAAPVGAESITKEQGDAILKELKEIRKELQAIKKAGLRGPGRRGPAKPVTAKVETKGSPSLGDPECPHYACRVHRLPMPLLPKVLSQHAV